MQLNQLYSCGICQLKPLKLLPNTALGCNHQSTCFWLSPSIESWNWITFIPVAYASWNHWNCGRTQLWAATINQLACPSYSPWRNEDLFSCFHVTQHRNPDQTYLKYKTEEHSNYWELFVDLYEFIHQRIRCIEGFAEIFLSNVHLAHLVQPLCHLHFAKTTKSVLH